jgi:hypothetical protein
MQTFPPRFHPFLLSLIVAGLGVWHSPLNAQCTLTCPANIIKSNTPNQCGAITTYPAPTASNCDIVTCTPPSGSFFPVGTTTVTCSGTPDVPALVEDGTVYQPVPPTTCTFTVRVNDTQPPLITAPPDITTGLCPPANIPNGTLGNPLVSDNCPGVVYTRLGLPPGNNFPPGTTIITYHAIDASSNTADSLQRVTVSTAHHIHGHISTNPPSHTGNVSHEHHGQHGHIVPAPACPPHVPGHSAAGATEDVGGLMTSPPDFVAALNADGTRVPARRGQPLALFGSAGDFYVGDQEEWPAANFAPPASGQILYYTTRLPEVRVGGVNAQVLFSGLAPGLPGVWQINIVIPAGMEPGSNVPAVIRYADEDLNATLTVE